MMWRYFILASMLLFSLNSDAKIDLVTLPTRDQVQLTIYNPADLTLVRDQRILTLKKGINRLEFGWENTLIDPTSVHLTAPHHAEQVRLIEVAYPPNTKGSAIWQIDSQVDAAVPVEITFFASGIAWESFYMGTLSADEQTLHLQNYVWVKNYSGETYENAQTRVVVGQVQLLDNIASLAQRQYPYNSPVYLGQVFEELEAAADMAFDDRVVSESAEIRRASSGMQRPKKIQKQAVSEYFLYTIAGTETIPDGWSKRLLSLEAAAVPVKALYRYDEARYGQQTQRFLFFKNDKAHQLGTTPLPDGQVQIYRQLPESNHLSYVGGTSTRYIPLQQEAEWQLGRALQVKVESKLMDYRTDNYTYNRKRNISGYDEIQTWQLTVQNNRKIPVKIEILRHTPHGYWSIQHPEALNAEYAKEDIDTFKYTLTLTPLSEQLINYELTVSEGERQR